MNYEVFFRYLFSGVALSVVILVAYRCYCYKREFAFVYQSIKAELSQIYFCRHNFFSMVENSFFPRFSNYNHCGFCYTVSAAVMLGLKSFRQSRVVRGWVRDWGPHSWVEVRLCGQWWVIDTSCYIAKVIMKRHYYYRKLRPKVMVVYDYETFWNDGARLFRTRLEKPETSRIFVEMFRYYTPAMDNDLRTEGIENNSTKEITFFEDNRDYSLFSPEDDIRFCQEIVDDFMATPTCKSPRQNSLFCLEEFYKQGPRQFAQNAPI